MLEMPTDRRGKRIYLTQAGSTFLPHALNLLKAEEEAVHSVRPAGRLTGELSICSASSYAQEVLPGILLKFLTQHPGVNVTVKISDFLEDTTARLARGELDTEDIDIELYSYLIYSRDRWLNPVMKEFIRIAGESQKER